jgi:hypothetical protein
MQQTDVANVDASFRLNLFKNPFVNPCPLAVPLHANQRLLMPFQPPSTTPLNGGGPTPPIIERMDGLHNASYLACNVAMHPLGPPGRTAPAYGAPSPRPLNGKAVCNVHESAMRLPRTPRDGMLAGQRGGAGPPSDPPRLQRLRQYPPPVSLLPAHFVVNAGAARSRDHSIEGSRSFIEDQSPLPVQLHDLLYHHSEPPPRLPAYRRHPDGGPPPPPRSTGASAGPTLLPSNSAVNLLYVPTMPPTASGWHPPGSPAAGPGSGRSAPGALADVLDDYTSGDSGFGRTGVYANGVASSMRRNSINGDMPTQYRLHNLAVPPDCPPPPAPLPNHSRAGVPGPMPPAHAAPPPPLSEDSTRARFLSNTSMQAAAAADVHGGSLPLPATHHFTESPRRRASTSGALVPEMHHQPRGHLHPHHLLESNPRAALPPFVPLQHHGYGPLALPLSSHHQGIGAAAPVVPAGGVGHVPPQRPAPPGRQNAAVQRSPGAYALAGSAPHPYPATARAAVQNHAVIRWQQMRQGNGRVVCSLLWLVTCMSLR